MNKYIKAKIIKTSITVNDEQLTCFEETPNLNLFVHPDTVHYQLLHFPNGLQIECECVQAFDYIALQNVYIPCGYIPLECLEIDGMIRSVLNKDGDLYIESESDKDLSILICPANYKGNNFDGFLSIKTENRYFENSGHEIELNLKQVEILIQGLNELKEKLIKKEI